MGREDPITSSGAGDLKTGVEDEEIMRNSNSVSVSSVVVEIYPLSSYYFGSKESLPSKHHCTTLALRINSKYYSYRGLRTCVEAVMLVELFKHPHVLILQERNSSFSLPGGRLRPAETDVDGLKRKLSTKLSLELDDHHHETNWECLGMWWKTDIECTKLYLVRLQGSLSFIVPKNLKLLAVPLCQLHQNHKTYGEIIARVPKMLSKVSFNTVH